MKRLIVLLIIYLGLVGYFSSCESQPPIIVKEDCSEQIDSLNKYWIDVVKNLVTDPKDSINWIDSLRIKDTTIINWIDSLRIKDSTIINWLDSLVIRDSVKIRDSVVFVLGESFQIPIKEVRADTSGGGLIVSNIIDNILYYSKDERGTRWGASGYPHQLMFYFDTTYVVTGIWVNTYGWSEGYTHTLNIYSYSDKIKTIKTSPELWSKHQLLMVSSHVYIDVVAGENNWTDIAEIRLFGYLKVD